VGKEVEILDIFKALNPLLAVALGEVTKIPYLLN